MRLLQGLHDLAAEPSPYQDLLGHITLQNDYLISLFQDYGSVPWPSVIDHL